jgi:hypothetical protein
MGKVGVLSASLPACVCPCGGVVEPSFRHFVVFLQPLAQIVLSKPS